MAFVGAEKNHLCLEMPCSVREGCMPQTLCKTDAPLYQYKCMPVTAENHAVQRHLGSFFVLTGNADFNRAPPKLPRAQIKIEMNQFQISFKTMNDITTPIFHIELQTDHKKSQRSVSAQSDRQRKYG